MSTSWMVEGWRENVTAAAEAAARLGVFIGEAQNWPQAWRDEWADDVSVAVAQVDAQRSDIGSALAYDEAGWTARYWQLLGKGVLLDAAPERGLGSPPKGWCDAYVVCLQAAGAVSSAAEAQAAAGVFAQVIGAASLTATDLKAAGVTTGQVVQAAAGASGIVKGAAAIGGLFLLGKILKVI